MQLRIFTSPDFISSEAHYIQLLFEAGLTCLHLRKPAASVLQYAQLIQQIPQQFHSKIYLHQYPELADKYSLAGYHLRSTDRVSMSEIAQKELLEYFKNSTMQLGTSVHHPTELERLAADYDYLTVSPVFSSISKLNYHPSYRWLVDIEKHKTTVVALGGIDTNTLELAYRRGFRSVACLGAIWENPPLSLTKYKQLCQIIHSIDQ